MELKKYRDKKLKLTPQRISILKVLEGNTTHPCAEKIYKEVIKTHPTMSFATVYNTLRTLRDMGEIQELTIDPKKKHYDPNTNVHNHLICVKCRKIVDIFQDYSDKLDIPREIAEEFTILGSHSEFYGLCRKCKDS